MEIEQVCGCPVYHTTGPCWLNQSYIAFRHHLAILDLAFQALTDEEHDMVRRVGDFNTLLGRYHTRESDRFQAFVSHLNANGLEYAPFTLLTQRGLPVKDPREKEGTWMTKAAAKLLEYHESLPDSELRKFVFKLHMECIRSTKSIARDMDKDQRRLK